MTSWDGETVMEDNEIPRKKRMNLKGRVILVLILAAAIIVTLNVTVFRLRYVSVTGNYHVPAENILSMAGLDRGGLYFFVSEDRVKKGIESNSHLEFIGLEKNPPDAVVIHIRERNPAAYITYQGRTYLLDTRGYVLDGQVNTAAYPLQLRGITVRDVRVGEEIQTAGQQQMNAFSAVAEELLVQGMLQQFVEINVTDAKNVFLVTSDGFVATLGKPEDVRAKLLTLGGVMQYSATYGLKPGSLDASVPGYCTYTPEN